MNGVVALILRFFAEFDSLQADYVIVVEDRPVMSIKYCFFTALHEMQTRSSDENSVCRSVRLSVRLSHA